VYWIRRQQKGYTLVELITVVVLIGLMLVLSVPRFRNSLLKNNLKTSSRQIVGLVKSAREAAIREHTPYRLLVDIDLKKIWVESGQPVPGKEGDMKSDVLQLPANVRVRDVWTRKTGTQVSNMAVILLSSKGYIEPAIIHLEGGGRLVSLELTPFLGTVEIHDSYVEHGG